MSNIIVELTNNISGRLIGEISPDLKKRLVEVCSYEIPGAYFSPQMQMGVWDGRKNLLSTVTWRFPLGLFARIRFVFKEKNIEYTVNDLRKKPVIELQASALRGITFRDYQEEAIRVALARGRGIIKVATGGGKSIIIAGLVAAMQKDAIINIYVHRNTLLRQLQNTFKDVGIENVGIIGDGEKRANRVTICSVASASHKTKSEDEEVARICESNKAIMSAAQMVIIDECQHLPASSFQLISRYSPNAYYRFGFSATPWREDNSDILIEAVTGKLVSDLGASELIRRGCLVKPTIYFVNVPPLPYTKRDGYPKIYKEVVVENDLRNSMIAMLAEKCHQEHKTCLIAVSRIKHGETLYNLISKVIPENRLLFIQGEGTTGEMKYKVLQAMQNDKLSVVIATTVFGEGIDIPRLDVLINTKGASSSIDTFQLVGRALRKYEGKTKATIIDFYDQTMPYIKSHASIRLKVLSLEKEFIVKKVNSIGEIEL